jgi:hypothetical protein
MGADCGKTHGEVADSGALCQLSSEVREFGSLVAGARNCLDLLLSATIDPLERFAIGQ